MLLKKSKSLITIKSKLFVESKSIELHFQTIRTKIRSLAFAESCHLFDLGGVQPEYFDCGVSRTASHYFATLAERNTNDPPVGKLKSDCTHTWKSSVWQLDLLSKLRFDQILQTSINLRQRHPCRPDWVFDNRLTLLLLLFFCRSRNTFPRIRVKLF